LLGDGAALSSLLQAGDLPSLILWGPPGCGKTTLARVLASRPRTRFEPLSAVTAGVKEIRSAVERAQRQRHAGIRTLLFLDELHRLNRAQQDTLLPHVEAGTVTLMGATTENPSFEVIAPLLSRCRVFTLKRLEPAAPSAFSKPRPPSRPRAAAAKPARSQSRPRPFAKPPVSVFSSTTATGRSTTTSSRR
jgi:putative ATPase